MTIRLKITLACIMFVSICAGMGSFADRTQTTLGDLAINIYDGAYLGMSYIGRAQSEFLRYSSMYDGAPGKPIDAASRKRLGVVLDNLDIAIDRAMSREARALAKTVRAQVADVTEDTSVAALAMIDANLATTVQRYGMDGLDARDGAEAFVADAQMTLWRAIFVALALTVLVGMMLDQSVIPSLKRGVAIARAIAIGKLDNKIVASGKSEAAYLLRALARMQAAILQSNAETKAAHEAEARQQKVHEADLTTSLERLRELSDSTFEGLLIHRDGAVLDANAAFCAMVGLDLNEIQGKPVEAFMGLWDEVRPPVAGADGSEINDIMITTGDGEMLPVETRSRNIEYAGVGAQVTALRDIRGRRAAEHRIRFLAHHDVLTGLANRFLLNDVFHRELANSRLAINPLAVLCIDLDRFKAVNDTFGHHAGDQLLKQVAERLRENIRGTDTAARVGGDEFIILQTATAQPSSAVQLAGRLIECLSKPYDLDGQQVHIGASIGIALQGDEASAADELIRNADLALYHVKNLGRGSYCLFKTEMEAVQRERRELEHDLALAISTGRLEVAYQPLFNADSKDIVGFEALVRWPHPTRGLIQPDVFIPLAEETGLIVPLGKWVLETACQAAAGWEKPCQLAVNISARQFKVGDLPGDVAGILARTGLRPDRLELEVTESMLIDDTNQALAALTALKALGPRVVLDDFGTGFSSLSYLQRFPFDKIKIDKSFIKDLAQSSGDHAIVNAIVAMSKQLGLRVTAEGVETKHQLALLCAAGCDEIQGFFLGQPMEPKAAEALLADIVFPPVMASIQAISGFRSHDEMDASAGISDGAVNLAGGPFAKCA